MKSLSAIALTGLCLVAGLNLCAQNRLRVNNTGVSAPYTTIAAAQAAAVSGDILIVEHSDNKYDGGGTIDITKKLTIYGAGYFLPDNNPTDSTQADSRPSKVGKIVFGPGSTGAVIMGITADTVIVNADSVTVGRCRILGRVAVGTTGNRKSVNISQNFISGDAPVLVDVVDATNIILANNLLENNSLSATHNVRFVNGSGLVLNNNFFGNGLNVFKNAAVQNNYFTVNTPIDVPNSTNVTVTHNISADNFFMGNYPFSNNLHSHPPDSLFNCYIPGATSDRRFILNPFYFDQDNNPATNDNPAYLSGADGKDRCMYGGSLPYVPSGMPPIPSIWFYSGPATGTQNGGVTVTIRVKTRN